MKFTAKRARGVIGGEEVAFGVSIGAVMKLKEEFNMKLSDFSKLNEAEDEIEAITFMAKFMWACLLIDRNDEFPTFKEFVYAIPLNEEFLELGQELMEILNETEKKD